MCGILGVIGPPPPEGDLDRALDLLTHRGPDDRGTWSAEGVWLGHRRLSIIDGPGGHQPMIDEATGVVITFNGEIYNYIELRRELERHGHAFRSKSDTEVLLRSYLHWGVECLEHLNGMWAFLIWDARSRRAFFARDRFGVKPLYYATSPGGLMVASEPKALLMASPSLRRVDESAVHDLLADKRVHHDERTFYLDIKSLPPGHWGEFRPDDRAPRLQRYWERPQLPWTEAWSEAEGLDRFAALLADAVAIRLRSDVPVGLTLSGGIDSTAILDAMARIRGEAGTGVSSYTAGYDGGMNGALDERQWARVAASAYSNVKLTEVNAAGGEWLEILRRIVWHMDGPGFSPAVFPMWMIMAKARADRVPVILEGQGADEIFAGYARYAALAFVDRLTDRASVPSRARGAFEAAKAGRRASSAAGFLRDVAVELVPPVRAWDGRRRTLTGALSAQQRGRGFKRVSARDGHGPVRAHVGGRVEGQLAADFSRHTLPAFLQYGDAVSMAHSIEVRLPFLDYRLVEFGISLPPPARIAKGETKRLLRSYLRQAGQTEVADRHDKRGYPTPANQWLAADNGAILRELLLDPGARTREMVDPDRLRRQIDRHVAGGYAAGDALYALLATEIWWRQAETEASRTGS